MKPGKRITLPVARNSRRPAPACDVDEVWSSSASAIWQATVRFQISS